MKVYLREAATVGPTYFARGENQVDRYQYECLKAAGKLVGVKVKKAPKIEDVRDDARMMQKKVQLHTNILNALKNNGVPLEQALSMSEDELVKLKGIGLATAKKILK